MPISVRHRCLPPSPLHPRTAFVPGILILNPRTRHAGPWFEAHAGESLANLCIHAHTHLLASRLNPSHPHAHGHKHVSLTKRTQKPAYLPISVPHHVSSHSLQAMTSAHVHSYMAYVHTDNLPLHIHPPLSFFPLFCTCRLSTLGHSIPIAKHTPDPS